MNAQFNETKENLKGKTLDELLEEITVWNRNGYVPMPITSSTEDN
jgi:hypothetical protein